METINDVNYLTRILFRILLATLNQGSSSDIHKQKRMDWKHEYAFKFLIITDNFMNYKLHISERKRRFTLAARNIALYWYTAALLLATSCTSSQKSAGCSALIIFHNPLCHSKCRFSEHINEYIYRNVSSLI